MYVFSDELFPISFAKPLNGFVFSEELFPISFAKLLNEFVFSEELFPISITLGCDIYNPTNGIGGDALGRWSGG